MKLYIARHAQSRALMDDHSEELSAEGIRQAYSVGQFLRDGGAFQPSEIWHSSAPCSFQTATIYKEEAAWEAELVNRDDMVDESGVDAAYDEICRRDKSIAIVGHKLHLQLLYARIMGSGRADTLEFVNGSVICLGSTEYYLGVGRRLRRWSVLWFVNPSFFEISRVAKVS
jgi:phosphohistidine phosphatase SixA